MQPHALQTVHQHMAWGVYATGSLHEEIGIEQLGSHPAQPDTPYMSMFIHASSLIFFASKEGSAPYISTNPPPLFNMSTGLLQVGQSPLEPPLVVKHGRHRKRVPEPTSSMGSPGRIDVGSGYMVASGGKGDEHKAQMNVERVSLGCRIEP